MKSHILDSLGIMLLKHGYVVKQLTRSCFDLLARKDSNILLIKVLEDANSVTPIHSFEMIRAARYLIASPIIVAEKAGDMLNEGVIYSRFNIYTLTLGTLEHALSNRMPFLRRTKAGVTAHLRGSELKRLREQNDLSLQNLSLKLGVSRRMITRYENEGADITFSKALELYDIFGHQVFEKIELFSSDVKPPPDVTTSVSRKYHDLGFMATDTRNLPFDVIAKKDREIILTGVGDKPSKHLISLSRLIDVDNLVIFRKKKPKGVPSLSKKEFLEIERASELVKFVHDEKYL